MFARMNANEEANESFSRATVSRWHFISLSNEIQLALVRLLRLLSSDNIIVIVIATRYYDYYHRYSSLLLLPSPFFRLPSSLSFPFSMYRHPTPMTQVVRSITR